MSEARLQETPELKPGTFCWVDLGTTDAAGAKRFYGELFGWTYEDRPAGPDLIYSMVNLNGKKVAGLYEMGSELRAKNIPPHWLSYVLVANADETAAKAKSAGATLIDEPFDVMTVGRMAVIRDPADAVFALWQPGTHKGADVYNSPGSLCWNELGTRDTKKAGEFYSNVFGWGRDVQNFGMEYTIFKNGDRGNGGMFGITPEMGNLPPHWLAYFATDDCDAKTQKAVSLGGKIMKEPTDIPGVGRFSILVDPQGAAFALIKVNNPE